MKSLISFLLSIPSALAGGFVFSHIWNWFILRKFPGLPELTFLDAVGILIVAGFPLLSLHVANAVRDARKEHDKVDTETQGIIVSLLTIFLLYPIFFGIAYLWHLVIGN